MYESLLVYKGESTVKLMSSNTLRSCEKLLPGSKSFLAEVYASFFSIEQTKLLCRWHNLSCLVTIKYVNLISCLGLRPVGTKTEYTHFTGVFSHMQ